MLCGDNFHVAIARVAGAGGFISKMAYSYDCEVDAGCHLGAWLGFLAFGFDFPPSGLLGLLPSVEVGFQEAGSRSCQSP